MPLEALPAAPALGTVLGARPLPEQQQAPTPTTGDAFGAAFRSVNTLGSAIAGETNGVNNDYQKGYDAWADIKGTDYEPYWSSFTKSYNPRYTAALKQQIDRENADRRTMDASGWTGTAAGLIAGVLDPTLLVPVGGEISLAGKGVWNVAKAGAIAGGVGVATQELGLQATQETRTAEESITNIGTGIVLGGLLGGGLGLLTRGQREASEAALEHLATAPPASYGSIGAAAVERFDVDQLTTAGRAAGFVADKTSFISPVLRLQNSPSPVAREIGLGVYEGSTYLNLHGEGSTLGPSAELLSASKLSGRQVARREGVDAIWQEARKSGLDMSFEDFNDAVGRAMRNTGDQGDDPFVSRAAALNRSTLVDPYHNEGVAAGLFEEGDNVAFADNYFPRSYRKEFLEQHEFDLKEALAPHIEEVVRADFEKQQAVKAAKVEAAAQEKADLLLAPDARLETLSELETRGATLDTVYAPEFAIRDDINALRRDKPPGWQEQVKALTEKGGDRLKQALAERGRIRSRHRRVNMNYAGMESRAQRTLNQIEDLQSASARSLGRLVDKGRKLQTEAERLDPAKLEARLSRMRSDFAQILKKSEDAMDRTAKAAERAGDDAPAALADRLKREAAAEVERHKKLTSLAERIDDAQRLDPEARLAEMTSAAEEAAASASKTALSRGEKLARLKERAAALDPKNLDARAAALDARAAKAERDFNERWATRGDATGEGYKELSRGVLDDFWDNVLGRKIGDESSVPSEFRVPVQRGPFKARALPVPDTILDSLGMLDNNADRVLSRYGRQVGADIELTKKFGGPTLKDQLASIHDDYAKLRAEVKDQPRKLKALNAQERADIRDVQAGRDLMRGTYAAKENGTGYGRLVRAALHFQFLTKMGGAAISSLGEMIRPAMVHGLGRYMEEGIGPLMAQSAGVKASQKEGRIAGAIGERWLHQKSAGLSGVMDPYAQGNALERFIENMSEKASTWTGLSMLTDFEKSISTTMSQNRLLEGVTGGKDERWLRYLGVGEDDAAAIAGQFAEHGEVLDGVHVANTQAWTDPRAVEVYRAAIYKDTSSVVTTPGIGDVPLFFNTPTGRLLFQFRSFNMAAHQKLLLRGLQEDKARFLSGMIGMSTVGMAIAALKSWRGGEDRWEKFKTASQNPGYLIAEGLDNSGIFSIPFDASNTVEKLRPGGFTFNPIKTPLEALGRVANPDAPMGGASVRFTSRSPLSVLLGPSAGTLEDVSTAIGGPTSIAQTGSISNRQRKAALNLTPFNSYLPIREMIQATTGDSPYGEF